MNKQNSQTDFAFEFNRDGVDYSFFIMKNEENGFHIKISKPLNPNYWETYIKYEEFQKKFPFVFLSSERFFEYVIYCIESNEFEMKFETDLLKLEFTFETGRGRFMEKIIFNIDLLNKVGDIKENLNDMAMFVKKLDNQYESFKNSIEVKFADMEEKLTNNMKNFMEKLIEKNQSNEEEVRKEIKSFIEKEQNKLALKRIDLSNDLNLLNMNTNRLQVNPSPFYNQGINQLYPKFINQNLQNVIVSNDNRTIEKTENTSWIGVRGEEIPAVPGIYQFSIRVDKTNDSCYIMFGFCLNTHNGAAVFWNGNCLAMFYLYNGVIYCPSLGNSAATNFRGIPGIVVSATIDTTLKLVYFSINGINLSTPKCFKLNDEDITKICPCVDIHTAGDKVSIVKAN